MLVSPTPPGPASSGASCQVSDSSTKKSAMKNRYPLQNSASKMTIVLQYATPALTLHSQSPRKPKSATCNNSFTALKNRSISRHSQVPRINHRLFDESERPSAASNTRSSAILRHGSNSRHDDYRTDWFAPSATPWIPDKSHKSKRPQPASATDRFNRITRHAKARQDGAQTSPGPLFPMTDPPSPAALRRAGETKGENGP